MPLKMGCAIPALMFYHDERGPALTVKGTSWPLTSVFTVPPPPGTMRLYFGFALVTFLAAELAGFALLSKDWAVDTHEPEHIGFVAGTGALIAMLSITGLRGADDQDSEEESLLARQDPDLIMGDGEKVPQLLNKRRFFSRLLLTASSHRPVLCLAGRRRQLARGSDGDAAAVPNRFL